jgi:hypothetical protein
MDVKEAVRSALTYAADLFADQQIDDLCLEEVQRDEYGKDWCITVGFTRRGARPGAMQAVLGLPRVYKVVRVSSDGALRSVTNREV